MRSVNVMESNGTAPTIVMNPRVTRRLRGESGIMQEDDLLIVCYLSRRPPSIDHISKLRVLHVIDGHGNGQATLGTSLGCDGVLNGWGPQKSFQSDRFRANNFHKHKPVWMNEMSQWAKVVTNASLLKDFFGVRCITGRIVGGINM